MTNELSSCEGYARGRQGVTPGRFSCPPQIYVVRRDFKSAEREYLHDITAWKCFRKDHDHGTVEGYTYLGNVQYAMGKFKTVISSPGIFIRPGNQAAVINHADGCINDTTKHSDSTGQCYGPANRGDLISIYGTGFGPIPNAPPDGQAPTGVVNTDVTPDVFIGAGYVPGGSVQFSGLSPQYPGLWQINVTIPSAVAPGRYSFLGNRASSPSGRAATPAARASTTSSERRIDFWM